MSYLGVTEFCSAPEAKYEDESVQADPRGPPAQE